MNVGNDRERADITDSGRDRRSASAHTPNLRLHRVKIIQVQSLLLLRVLCKLLR